MGTLNPYREFVAGISPTEFEVLCLEILKNYAEAEHLSDFSIQHNVFIPADDGTYQIDVYARFIAMGVEFKVITECKRYSSPVSREKVAVLADKVKSLGAHKGIMISTCGFQIGAYAKEYATMDFPDRTIYPSPQMMETIRREFVLAHKEILP